jgi:RHS repeat-associated protein
MTTPKHISTEYQTGLPRIIGQSPAKEFTGKVYGARYCLGELSVWLSVDPLSDRYPSISSYMYVLGNPIKYNDPDGKNPGLIAGVVSVGVKYLIAKVNGDEYDFKKEVF